MFYDKFAQLCAQNGVSLSKAAREAGINKASVTYWKNHPDSMPTGQVAAKIAEYFGVSVGELYEDPSDHQKVSENPSVPLSDKEQRDIARTVEQLMDDLSGAGDLMFDGVPMSDEDRNKLSVAMEVALGVVRQKNKETYTPKKYKDTKEN